MIRLPEIATCKQMTNCKVCPGAASLYGVVDFNKNCEEQRGHYLPLSGVPVYYHQCQACGLVFSEALDQWKSTDYGTHIYNEKYVEVDPDYIEVRPRAYSEIVREFLRNRPMARHLDYGGGNGSLSSLLRAQGFDSSTWDPMDSSAADPQGVFTVVTAFEVFEHTPAPVATLRDILKLCDASDPLILFSTYTVDKLTPRSMDFWYFAPRNGHITIHTETSLHALFQAVGLRVHHYGNGFHLAYRSVANKVDLSLFARLHRRGRVRRGLLKVGKLIGIGGRT